MNRTVLSESPRMEQHGIRLALWFLGRKVPQRMARGQFMLIYRGRFGREVRDQHHSVDELYAALRRLPRKCRYGDGRQHTFFAVTVPDDVWIGDEARVSPWSDNAREVLERAAGERAEVVRRDLRGHGKVKAAYKQETQARRQQPTVAAAPAGHSFGSLVGLIVTFAAIGLSIVAVLR